MSAPPCPEKNCKGTGDFCRRSMDGRATIWTCGECGAEWGILSASPPERWEGVLMCGRSHQKTTVYAIDELEMARRHAERLPGAVTAHEFIGDFPGRLARALAPFATNRHQVIRDAETLGEG